MPAQQRRSALEQAWDTAGWAYGQASQGVQQVSDQAWAYAEAGNAAAQEALRSGVESAQGVANGLRDGAQGFLDEGATLLGELAGQSPGVAAHVPPPPPGGDALGEEAPQQEEAPAYERGDTYLNQRDNQSAHVEADVSCSPTSFTMALIDRHGGDEASVRSQAIELIEARGGDTSYQQTEELIIELLQKIDWATACAEKPQFFWNPSGWAAWARSTYGGRYYKDPNAQQYVASLFTGSSSSEAQLHSGIYTFDAWAPVISALDAGATASAEGGFTSSGHVVNIVNADASGVTINDPYGLWLRSGQSYLRNGAEQVPALGADDLTILDRRASTNSAIRAAYDSFDDAATAQVGFARWGERNFYSWADVDRVKLGKWVSVLS